MRPVRLPISSSEPGGWRRPASWPCWRCRSCWPSAIAAAEPSPPGAATAGCYATFRTAEIHKPGRPARAVRLSVANCDDREQPQGRRCGSCGVRRRPAATWPARWLRWVPSRWRRSIRRRGFFLRSIVVNLVLSQLGEQKVDGPGSGDEDGHRSVQVRSSKCGNVHYRRRANSRYKIWRRRILQSIGANVVISIPAERDAGRRWQRECCSRQSPEKLPVGVRSVRRRLLRRRRRGGRRLR